MGLAFAFYMTFLAGGVCGAAALCLWQSMFRGE